jgi:CRISPR system Cascade subunit CasC
MDDLKATYAPTQTEGMGAAFLGSGETETFFNSAVYYKYLNLDVDAVRKHLSSLSGEEAARVAGVLLSAATLANPTGKQNSFAAHAVPELILVEVSKVKRPMSYANAFLQPVEGGMGRNLMTDSARALGEYIDCVAAAFAPTDVRRILLAVGPASVELGGAHRVGTLDDLIQSVVDLLIAPPSVEVTT